MDPGGNLTGFAVLAAVAATVASTVAAATTVLVLARARRRARRAVTGVEQATRDGVWRPGDPGYGDTLRANTIYPEEWPEAWQDDRRAGMGEPGWHGEMTRKTPGAA